MSKNNVANNAVNNEPMIDMNELMEKIGVVSKHTIYKMIREGMPVYYPCRSPRFFWHEVVEWVKNKPISKG